MCIRDRYQRRVRADRAVHQFSFNDCTSQVSGVTGRGNLVYTSSSFLVSNKSGSPSLSIFDSLNMTHFARKESLGSACKFKNTFRPQDRKSSKCEEIILDAPIISFDTHPTLHLLLVATSSSFSIIGI
eukprot:TRINITY_DN5117_c0_g3_i1.p1 TRINITY_DN5117_c0_g3~~TRINITY_DN5117_c0_g3_i1.p1  ORF type:complete len:128 (-),score=25.51 TRINITY_DN5117_c0_g3_i1:102-485(-)